MSAGIFRPPMPNQAVATLLLIENSRTMASLWSDLRDHYLQPLVETLERPYPPVPTTMFVLPSLPPTDDPSLYSAVHHQSNGLHNGLRDIRFNYDPSNRLTPARISTGIDLLASTKFQGQAAALHLVIVAATAPSEDPTGLELGLPPEGGSVWHLLAEKMSQADILCHIVLASSQNMSSLTSMFDETIRLQKNVEVAPWFPTDQESYITRLSSRPGHQGYSHLVSAPYSPPPLPRSPPDIPNAANSMHHQEQLAPLATVKVEASPSTSLVSQLQQVHGLTKKKVYGTKPARQPFFRDERPPAQHPVPLPLKLASIPPAIIDVPTQAATSPQPRDGRAPSHSRVDRLMRLNQGSPTDQHPRLRGRWSRRGSRLSSPEGDALPSPGSLSSLSEMSSATSYFSSTVPSPVSPSATIDDVYQVQPIIQTTSPGLMMPGDGGVIPEPPWLQHQQQHAFSEAAAYSTKPRQAPRAVLPANHNGAMVTDQPYYHTTLQYNYTTSPSTPSLNPYDPARPPTLSEEQQHLPSSPQNMGMPAPASRRTTVPLSGKAPPSHASVAERVPRSKSFSKSAMTLPASSLDLNFDTLPPLSPEDGDRPFFIFEQNQPDPPPTTTALFNSSMATRGSIQQQTEPLVRDYQPYEADQRQIISSPSPQTTPPMSYYDHAGFYQPTYSQQYTRENTDYIQPVVNTSSSLTGWAG
ncbi:hypothetical protein PC9H_002581 [Pleurotus ostreatus]|uniref:Mediator of RNA polymerase II transcription subunit 25 n=1 Tax=Pleurotus ostreatus TaxID=5322 RepID=A0A8H6ZK67_PLEOS|nr:uncharacterized protein PC9H_002581 [Pleurotus ostreatus]KAF7416316.1 hypothetical protein PC9H_002581 [Pleurotus ostreatus]KAJ8689194.1 hypothetical protein PTI98_013243 [Pleurotus ostreatus]